MEISESFARILNNIVREVEAIRGYLIDPVEGDFIIDEIGHIEELCALLRTACAGEPAAQENTEDGEESEDGEGEEYEPEDDEEEVKEDDE